MLQVKPNRYVALDVLRGMTVAGMILVNNPGSWGHIFPPLEHKPWVGCTPTDMVFPFFLFVVSQQQGSYAQVLRNARELLQAHAAPFQAYAAASPLQCG